MAMFLRLVGLFRARRLRRWAFARIGLAFALTLASVSYAQASTYPVYTSSISATSLIASDGYCSLAEAVASANAGHSMYNCPEIFPGGDQQIQIIEAPGKSYADYHFKIASLTLNSPNRWISIFGQSASDFPFIDSTGTSGFIVPLGAKATFFGINLTFVGGSAGGRLVENHGTIDLQNVTLAKGNVTTHPTGRGGAFFNEGTATCTNSTLHSNRAKKGGAIYNNGGTIDLTGTSITGNTATMAGGGVYNDVTTSSQGRIRADCCLLIWLNSAKTGGGIFNRGLINLNGPNISYNTASGTGSGEVDAFGNTCDGMGGGILSKLFTNPDFSNYTAVQGDGNGTNAITSHNTASSGFHGGAIGGDGYAELGDGTVSFSWNGPEQCRSATGRGSYTVIANCPP